MSRAWLGLKLGIVTATFGLCAGAYVLRPTSAAKVPPPRPSELYSVIMEHLRAQRAADYSAAYRQVSFSMQERYNAEDFAEFLRTDHPDLQRSHRVEFGSIRVNGRRALVPAYFFMNSGGINLVYYSLVREEGRWKIDGSRIARRWDADHRVGGERT